MKLLISLGLAAVPLLLAACVLGTATPEPSGAEESTTTEPTATRAPTPTPASGAANTLTPTSARDGTTRRYSQPPAMTVDVNAQYTATIRTNKGPITLQLLAAQAPITVNNFVFLAQNGYYDGTTFHRVIRNFMIQGGDPTGTSRGGPGYAFQDEIVEGLLFDRAGVLAMANRGPNTNGSQFFITVGPTPHLDGKHTIFGIVVSGMEVVDNISTVSTDRGDRPTAPVVVERIEITQSGS